MKLFYIYKIYNKINGKVYIGKTSNIKKRWIQHLSDARRHKTNSPIHNAINKYGEENFTIQEIDCDAGKLKSNMLEQWWIEYYKSYIGKYGDKFGYNLTAGGDGMQSGTLAGERNPKSKLTNEQADSIRSSKESTKQLATQYGVDRTTIQRIRSGSIRNKN